MPTPRLAVVLTLATIIALCVIIMVPRYKWEPRSCLKYNLAGLVTHGCHKLRLMTGWACLNVKVCEDNLRLFHDVVRGQCGIEFWLSEGTALGVRRDAAIMPHDDDVDVAAHHSDLSTFLECAMPKLRSVGFEVCKVWNDGFFVTLRRGGETLDIDFVREGEKCMFMTVGKQPGFQKCHHTKRFTDDLRTVRFLDRDFLLPSDDYLVHQYGTDWGITRTLNQRCRARR